MQDMFALDVNIPSSGTSDCVHAHHRHFALLNLRQEFVNLDRDGETAAQDAHQCLCFDDQRARLAAIL